jgi:hypothetical protein
VMPTPHWLTPIAERLARAEEIARSAQDLVRQYEASGKASILKELDGADVVLRMQLKTPPPPRLPLMVGESIHELRSSLDNLVVLLADRSASRSLTVGETRHLQFPIASTPEAFTKNRQQLRGLSDAYIQRIEEVQPYHLLEYALGEAASISPDNEPLAQLRELSNHDKHRRIYLVLHRPSRLEVHHNATELTPHVEWTHMPLTDGVVVARVKNADASEVHASVELTLDHPISRQPIRLESLISRLVGMLAEEVIPHITGDRDLLGHPTRALPALD